MEFDAAYGLYLPHIGDDVAVPDILHGLPTLEKAIELCDQRRTCIQAGGHVGIYPKRLSEEFDIVYSFEPVQENYQCLVKNAKKVRTFPKALSNINKKVTMANGSPKNTGAWEVKPGKEVEAISMDSMLFTNVDLVQLDVEGHELNVLEGAVGTIQKYKPVIMIEDRNHGPSCVSFMEKMKYKLAYKSATDRIYKCQ